MRSVNAVIQLILVTQTLCVEKFVNSSVDVQSLLDKFGDTPFDQTYKPMNHLIDDLVDQLFDRTFKDKLGDGLVSNLFDQKIRASALRHADIDSMTIGKPALLGAQADSRLRPMLQRRPFLGTSYKGSGALRARSAASATAVRSSAQDVKDASTIEDVKVAAAESETEATEKLHMDLRPRALQIVNVNTDTDEVKVQRDNIRIIEEKLKAEGVDRVSIVSVMGSYRTGKSFLLDLMLRYLENTSPSEEDPTKAHVVPTSRELGKETGGKFEVPAWLTKGGKLTREDGFTWREGQDRCTQGVWIWNKPYVREMTVMEENGTRQEKIGILLMDTQGAWDSKMTAQQSATIFGLTTALSSKQIFNIQNRIGEDSLKALDYFAQMAVAAERLREQQGTAAAKSQSESKSVTKPFQFQELQILVRDWVNFDDTTWDNNERRLRFNVSEQVASMERWPVDACMKQMDMHFQQHFGPEVTDRRAVQSLEVLFNKLSAFLLPLPGKKVQLSKRWEGDVNEIDEDFLRFLDLFMQKTFTIKVLPQKVMGMDLIPDKFTDVVGALANAFEGMAFTSDTMVEAVGRATNLLSQDSAEKLYKKEMDRLLNDMNLTTDEFFTLEKEARERALGEYTNKAIFGDERAIQRTEDELKEKLESNWQDYKDKFKRRLSDALVALAPAALGAIALFALDKATDITCDWWSESCRDFSTTLTDIYGPVLAGITAYAFYLLRNEKTATIAAAALDFQKELITIGSSVAETLGQVSASSKSAMDSMVVTAAPEEGPNNESAPESASS